MASIEVEIKKAQARGDKKVDDFGGKTINTFGATNLREGDIFTIPEDFDIYEQTFGTGDDENVTYYIFVDVYGSVRQLYPSFFTKSREVYNEDGTGTGNYVEANGTAVDIYTDYATVDEGIKALVGKELKVTKMTKVRTQRFNSTKLTYALIPTVDVIG